MQVDLEKFIWQNPIFVLISIYSGAIAQLGERLHGMQEVVGSNPIGSIFQTSIFSWGFIIPFLKISSADCPLLPSRFISGHITGKNKYLEMMATVFMNIKVAYRQNHSPKRPQNLIINTDNRKKKRESPNFFSYFSLFFSLLFIFTVSESSIRTFTFGSCRP